jgi:outer membrane protein OmpA-like peptidoglycan-associated protein
VTLFEEENENLNSRLTEAQNSLIEVEILKTALNEKNKALTAAQAELSGLGDLREQLPAKTAVISELQNKVTLLEREKGTLSDRLEETLTKRLEETLTTLQKMDALRLALNEKNKALFAAEAELTELDRVKRELNAKTTTINKLKQRELEVLAEIEPQLSQLIISVATLEGEKAALSDRLKKTLPALQEMAALKASLEQKNKTLATAELKLTQLEITKKELESKTKELNKLQGKVTSLTHLESEVIKLHDSVATLNEEKSVLAANLKLTKTELNDAEMKKSALSANLVEVKAQVQPLREKIVQAERLAKEFAKKEGELTLTKKEFAEKEEKIVRLQDKLDELTKKTDEIETLRQQLDYKTQSTVQLNEKIKIMAERKQATVAEKDSDGDKVVDSLDLCPNSTPGSNVDELGCERDEKIVLTNITFAVGTVNLTEDSKKGLSDVVKTLALYPEIKLEVAGYTDNLGNINRNKSLSLQRANTVMNYLIEQGISADRLTARGYGPANSIADNNTSEGRALNRRVELHKVLPSP